MNKYLFLLLLIIGLENEASSQSKFTKVFNYTLADGAEQLYKDPQNENQFIILGGGSNNITGEYIQVLLLIDDLGQKLWDTIYSNKCNCVPYILGMTNFSEYNSKSFFYGTDLETLLPRIITMESNNSIKHIVSDKSYPLSIGQSGSIGSLIINPKRTQLFAFGHGWPYYNPKNNCVIFQTFDTSGSRNFTKYICSDTFDFLFRKAFRNNIDNVFDLFVHDSKNTGQLYLCKVDSIGGVISSRLIKSERVDNLTAVIQNKDGNYLLVGREPLPNRAFALLINPNGDSLVARDLGSSTVKFDEGCSEASSGGYYITGRKYITKFDKSLNQEWEKLLDANLLSTTNAIETSDGGILLAGEINYPDSNSDSLNSSDWIVYKLDRFGNATSIKEVAQNDLKNRIIIYPNPAINKVEIGCHIEMKEVLVFNAVGEVVFKNEDSSYHYDIDVSILPRGIYFIKTRIDNTEFTYKLAIAE